MKLFLNSMDWEEGKEWCIAEPKIIGWLKGLLMCKSAADVLHMMVWPWHMRSSTWVDGVDQREGERDWY
jgi:hypothetical protein